ncbi:universal stress protein [Amycolatopsis sp. NPDC003676]
MNGPVLVAFDGTPAAEHALSWAAAAAVRRGCELVVARTTWWPITLDPALPAVCLVPEARVDHAVEQAVAAWPALRVSGVESGGTAELLAIGARLDSSLIVAPACAQVPWRALLRGVGRPLAFAGSRCGPVVSEMRSRHAHLGTLALAFDLARSGGADLHVLHTAAIRHRACSADLAGFAVSALADWLVSSPDVAITYRLATSSRIQALKHSVRSGGVLLPAP